MLFLLFRLNSTKSGLGHCNPLFPRGPRGDRPQLRAGRERGRELPVWKWGRAGPGEAGGDGYGAGQGSPRCPGAGGAPCPALGGFQGLGKASAAPPAFPHLLPCSLREHTNMHTSPYLMLSDLCIYTHICCYFYNI